MATLLAALAAAGAWGCSCDELLGFFREPEAEIEAPSRGEIGGVAFSYPSNWRITAETTVEEGLTVRTAELESPGTSYMMVQVFDQPVPLEDELDSLLAEGIRQMRLAVNDMSAGLMSSSGAPPIERFERSVLGAPRQARRCVVRYTVLNEPLPYRMEVVGATSGSRTVLVMYGIAEEDWDRVAPGFDLVLDSLRMAPENPGG